MGLRSDAEQDLAVILETSDCGAVPIILVNPAEEAEDFNGQSGDISQVIDPDTGQAVSGRLAHVSLRISTILSRGFEMPRGIARESQKPWLVIFTDFQGAAYRFKVQSSYPDRTLGIVTLLLELYDVGVVVGGIFTFENGDTYNFENSDVFDFD
jgi:hypothetical protein